MYRSRWDVHDGESPLLNQSLSAVRMSRWQSKFAGRQSMLQARCLQMSTSSFLARTSGRLQASRCIYAPSSFEGVQLCCPWLKGKQIWSRLLLRQTSLRAKTPFHYLDEIVEQIHVPGGKAQDLIPSKWEQNSEKFVVLEYSTQLPVSTPLSTEDSSSPS